MKKLGLLAMPLLAITFLTNCNQDGWWNHTADLTESDIGKIETLTVNGQPHRVRLIGIDHDLLADGSGKRAHTTWEFVDLLSDKNGYSLATPWDWESEKGSLNYDFINSDLRKTMDGQGCGKIVWYEKGSKSQSNTYVTSAYDMLPGGLKSRLKQVNKPIAEYKGEESENKVIYEVRDYQTNLFPLSFWEYTKNYTQDVANIEIEGTTYKYYDEETYHESKRVKYQVKWHEGSLQDSVYVRKGDIKDACNYAGYNTDEKDAEGNYYGSYYWTRSPRNDGNEKQVKAAHKVRSNGNINTGGATVYRNLYPIAPAFCI